MPHAFKLCFRYIKRKVFYFSRQFVGIFFGFFLRKIHNPERLPKNGPCLIVSNHFSYLDSLIISSIYRKQYIVILASQDIKKQPIMHWLSKYNVTIFVDLENGGLSALRNIISLLRRGYIVLVYPEGTRSRSGLMGEPQAGFIKIAQAANVPIIPVSMKGTFDILPPHKIIPKLKRCELVVGLPIYINKENVEFSSLFNEKGNITVSASIQIAYKIMDKIARSVNQSWDLKVRSNSKYLEDV